MEHKYLLYSNTHLVALPSFLYVFLLIMLSFPLISVHCLHMNSNGTVSDIEALLAFKSQIHTDPSGALQSWDNNKSMHFCEWHGVTCNTRNLQQRVTGLELKSLNLSGYISPFIANLSFLERLHLTDNNLEGPIPEVIGFLTHLQHLNLSGNSLSGVIPLALFHSCGRLQNVSLKYNMLHGTIPRNVSNCLELRVLTFPANLIEGEIPKEFFSLPKIETLSLWNNSIEGSIPPEIGNAITLKEIYLGKNRLTGPIPTEVSNLTSLIHLSLESNYIAGGIPASLGRLSNLQFLNLDYNKLSGGIPPSLWNLSSLSIISLQGNQLYGTLPEDMGILLPHLVELYLNDNEFHGPLPSSLSNASSLQDIQLYANKFCGKIPESYGLLQSLISLVLYDNQLQATTAADWNFLEALTNCTKLKWLALGKNHLGGVLPTSIANLSTSLQKLTIYENKISGSIPIQIGNLANLTVLDMSFNLLSGSIPASLGRLSNLVYLYLKGNNFIGEIPSILGNLTKLIHLKMDNNQLEGHIPPTLQNCPLELLDLSFNKLGGSVPKEIMSISTLSIYLGLSHNMLTGAFPLEVGYLIALSELDASENKISGNIPRTLAEALHLEKINLAGNLLLGPIPSSFSQLKGLQALNVSHNNLSSHIPEFFGTFSSLTSLDLSFNDFEGELPIGNIFSNATAFFVLGNNKLCGGPQNLNLPPCSSQSFSKKHLSQKLLIIISIPGGIVCFILLLLLFFYFRFMCISKHKPPCSVEIGDQYVQVTYAELVSATNGFSETNLIGIGSFGVVYKGRLNFSEHYAVAVKVLNLLREGASTSFLSECELLRNIRHRNLLKVLTVCASIDLIGNDFKALVYEFMPNGSLEKWLHPRAYEETEIHTLRFMERLNILIDVACALEYLHNQEIVHCDLKPSNVLLDYDMVAHVGDFGLARFLNKPSTSSQDSSGLRQLTGSIGYVAPEYGVANKVSTEGDIYSFGILLLEMFTGKRPTDEIFHGGVSLHQYVARSFPKQVANVVYPQLYLNSYGGANHRQGRKLKTIISVLRIGICCSKDSPTERMLIKDVVQELTVIKASLVRSNKYIVAEGKHKV